MLDLLLPEAGAIYIMDRGYLDFERLYVLHRAGAFFVTRSKANLDARRIYSALTDRSTGIICDHTIALNGFYSRQHYPDHLRRIRFKDSQTGKALLFLTNQFDFPAATICALYKERWQVEIFFKWIKQHLRIKRFFGTSEERREIPNLDRRLRLRARGPRQKTPPATGFASHFVTDPFRHPVRKNAHPASVFPAIACQFDSTANVNQLNLFEF